MMIRPKLDIPTSRTEQWHHSISGIAILASLIYMWWNWGALPERIPTHFNALGEIDRWGGKGELLILPALSVILWIGLTLLAKYPHIYNYLVPITEQNAAVQYRLARRMLSWLKLEIVLLFTLLIWVTVGAADSGMIHRLGIYMPLCILVILCTIGYYLFKTLKAK